MTNESVSALATGIKNAFEQALPDDLNEEVRASIVATYDAMSLTLAQSIKTFVESAQVKVDLTAGKFQEAMQAYLTRPANISLERNNITAVYRYTPSSIVAAVDPSALTIVSIDGEIQ
ncbi:MAG: hypothetical protein PHX79_09315 [Sphaerochaetaceae bacterium]|nr:hypothetical protein [Sphaerochaetaceae bacterium]